MVEMEWGFGVDLNARPAIRECARCQGEIYGGEGELCRGCEAEIHSNDIAVEYAEAWPRRLFRFLREKKGEGYMEEFLAAFREFCEGNKGGCPDIDTWARS